MDRSIFYGRVKDKLDSYFIQEGYSFVKSKNGWVKKLKDKVLSISIDYYRTGDELSTMLDLSKQSKGLYILSFRTDNIAIEKKIVIQ